MSKKTLYKNQDNAKVSGVLAGIADYTDIDITVLRLAFIFLVIFTGFFPGVVFYIIATFIMDNKPLVNAE